MVDSTPFPRFVRIQSGYDPNPGDSAEAIALKNKARRALQVELERALGRPVIVHGNGSVSELMPIDRGLFW